MKSDRLAKLGRSSRLATNTSVTRGIRQAGLTERTQSVWSGEVSPRTNNKLIAGRRLPVAFTSSAEPVAIPLVEARASNTSPIDAFTASSAAVLQFLPGDVAGVVPLAVARSALDHSSALRPTKTSTAANYLPTTGSRHLTARRASHCHKILFVMRGRLRTRRSKTHPITIDCF